MADDGRRRMPKKYCPKCSGRLIDFKDAALWRRFSVETLDGEKNYDMVLRCERCHTTVGVIINKDTA